MVVPMLFALGTPPAPAAAPEGASAALARAGRTAGPPDCGERWSAPATLRGFGGSEVFLGWPSWTPVGNSVVALAPVGVLIRPLERGPGGIEAAVIGGVAIDGGGRTRVIGPVPIPNPRRALAAMRATAAPGGGIDVLWRTSAADIAWDADPSRADTVWQSRWDGARWQDPQVLWSGPQLYWSDRFPSRPMVDGDDVTVVAPLRRPYGQPQILALYRRGGRWTASELYMGLSSGYMQVLGGGGGEPLRILNVTAGPPGDSARPNANTVWQVTPRERGTTDAGSVLWPSGARQAHYPVVVRGPRRAATALWRVDDALRRQSGVAGLYSPDGVGGWRALPEFVPVDPKESIHEFVADFDHGAPRIAAFVDGVTPDGRDVRKVVVARLTTTGWCAQEIARQQPSGEEMIELRLASAPGGPVVVSWMGTFARRGPDGPMRRSFTRFVRLVGAATGRRRVAADNNAHG